MCVQTRQVGNILEVVVNPQGDTRIGAALDVLHQAFAAGCRDFSLLHADRSVELRLSDGVAYDVACRHAAAVYSYQPEIFGILQSLLAAPQWRGDRRTGRRLDNYRMV